MSINKNLNVNDQVRIGKEDDVKKHGDGVRQIQ
jgi:hypothetical protein